MNLYLIKRGPKPSYHAAPYHPVVLCTRRKTAKWEAGWTGDGACVWERESGARDTGEGWLLTRWQGLDVDYGHVVRGHVLPDGAHVGFWRDYEVWPKGIEDVLPGTAWWSLVKMPDWLLKRGVVYPTDTFTRTRIVDAELDNGLYGAERREHWPEWWPQEQAQ